MPVFTGALVMTDQLVVVNPAAGESLGQQFVLAVSTQDHAGGQHVGGIRRFCFFLFSDAASVESSRGVRVHPRGGGVRVLAAKIS